MRPAPPEQVSAPFSQAAAVARRCSGRFGQCLQGLDADLDAYSDVPAARDLKAQLRLAA